jgi:HPt (histidine-containing phosphotransfer) domain-containing protein
MDAPGFIDMSRLLAVCSMGGSVDEGLLVELLRLFLVDNDERLAAMPAALASGDGDTLRRLIHTVSGSASTAGATRLGAMARDLETGLRDGQLPAVSDLASLTHEFAAVRAALLGMYPALNTLV